MLRVVQEAVKSAEASREYYREVCEQAQRSFESLVSAVDLEALHELIQQYQPMMTEARRILEARQEAEKVSTARMPTLLASSSEEPVLPWWRADAEKQRGLEGRLDKLITLIAEERSSEARPLSPRMDRVKFHSAGLYLTYDGQRLARLTSLEQVLCSYLFSYETGYEVSTLEVEEALYPGERESAYRRDKCRKLVQRLNEKLKQETGIPGYIAYGSSHMMRKE